MSSLLYKPQSARKKRAAKPKENLVAKHCAAESLDSVETITVAEDLPEIHALGISETTRASPAPIKKKVSFWGWVDVRPCHPTDIYDRKPITPEPLKQEGALEVLEMRFAMRKATQDMIKLRDMYEVSAEKSESVNARLGAALAASSKSKREAAGKPGSWWDKHKSKN